MNSDQDSGAIHWERRARDAELQLVRARVHLKLERDNHLKENETLVEKLGLKIEELAEKLKCAREECDHWAAKYGRYVDKWNDADRLRNERDLQLFKLRERVSKLTRALRGEVTDVESVECVLACMAEGEGDDPKVYQAFAEGALGRLRKAFYEFNEGSDD